MDHQQEQKAGGVIEQLEGIQGETRRSMLREYRDLLTRADNPEPDDAQRLAKMAQMLGKTIEQVKDDAKTIAAVQQHRETLGDAAAKIDRFLAAKSQLDAYHSETQRIVQERREGVKSLEKAAFDAYQPASALHGARRQMKMLYEREPDLFDGEVVPAVDQLERVPQTVPYEPQHRRLIVP